MVLGSHQAPALFIYESVPWDAEAHRGWVVGLCPQRQEGRCGGQLNFTALVLLLASSLAQRRHPPDDDIQFDNTVLVYLLLPGSAVLPFVS